jgi:hypothetical protein
MLSLVPFRSVPRIDRTLTVEGGTVRQTAFLHTLPGRTEHASARSERRHGAEVPAKRLPAHRLPPTEIVADVRVAVARWHMQAAVSATESPTSWEDGLVEALVADLSELVHDFVEASQEHGSKLTDLADPAA